MQVTKQNQNLRKEKTQCSVKALGEKYLCVVEELTFFSFMFQIFPFVIREVFGKKSNFIIYYIDKTFLGNISALIVGRLFKISVKSFDFRLVDVKDDDGNLAKFRVEYIDCMNLQKEILKNRFFKLALQSKIVQDDGIVSFLIKKVAVADNTRNTLWRIPFLIELVIWKSKQDLGGHRHSILFMTKRLWMNEIRNYARKYNVDVRLSGFGEIGIKKFLIDQIGFFKLRGMYYYYLHFGFWKFLRQCFTLRKDIDEEKKSYDLIGENKNERLPKLMVQHYGQLNLDNPELHNDLFFWQMSKLDSKCINVMFNLPHDPLDKEKLKDIENHGMKAVVTNPKATVIDDVLPFHHWPNNLKKKVFPIDLNQSLHGGEGKWIKQSLVDYYQELDYWTNLFKQTETKAFITWFKHGNQIQVMTNALRQLGGVMAAYQRSYEDLPLIMTAVDTDLVFDFSTKGAQIQRDSGSIIPYHITVGYIGDHRFSLVKETAFKIRKSLVKNGADKIISFFDENSLDDSKWHSGHEHMREDYSFLLKKVIDCPWLGVVIKPKNPRTLKVRLGVLSELLDKAVQTGRCFVFEGGQIQGSFSPSVAALASDLAIHGNLAGGTAGVEAALTGTPTLLLDLTGWSMGSLNKLETGKVVFYDWETLWNICEEHFRLKKGLPGIGDWTDILDEIDPFRDGRSAERIGTYLYWIMEGFKSKLPRKTVMADAAQRYVDLWGKDKVQAINI